MGNGIVCALRTGMAGCLTRPARTCDTVQDVRTCTDHDLEQSLLAFVEEFAKFLLREPSATVLELPCNESIV